MTLRTLADVCKFIRHVPKAWRELDTWQHVIGKLEEAARGGDVAHASVALVAPPVPTDRHSRQR